MEGSRAASLSQYIQVLVAALVQDFMHSMKQHGLSMPQAHALMYIHHTGGCQVSDIGALGDASKAAASQLAERLVRQGLVERAEDPANRRSKILTLTAQGRALIAASLPSRRFLEEAISSLSPAQHETVEEALSILAQALGHTHKSIPKEVHHA